MKNPVTFSITDARSVQRKRQIRQIILLVVIILVILGAILVVRVATMKKEIDTLFPSDATLTPTPAAAGAETTPAGLETTAPADTAAVTATPGATVTPGVTVTPEATTVPETTGTDTSSTDTAPTEPPAATPAALPPEENVYLPDGSYLQKISYQARDSAYHKLQKDIEALIKAQTGARCGFYYVNLKNGEEFGYNDMLPFVVGSAINLPIVTQLYEQTGEGAFSMTDTLLLESSDITSGTGTIKNTGIGTSYDLRYLSYLSIVKKDNTATAMLLRQMGGIDAVNDRMKLISDIVDYRTNSAYVDYSGTSQIGMNRSSAQDLAKYMKYFYSKYMITPDVYQTLFNDLARSESEWGTGSALPSTVPVFHITGSNTVYGSETDLALIAAEEPYILCVTVESSSPEISRLLQQKLGELVYAYVHGSYT